MIRLHLMVAVVLLLPVVFTMALGLEPAVGVALASGAPDHALPAVVSLVARAVAVLLGLPVAVGAALHLLWVAGTAVRTRSAGPRAGSGDR